MEAGPFGRQGGDSGLAANMDVVNAAFSDLVLAQGVVSDPIDLGDNHIVLIHLKEHMPQARLPLDDVRDQVVESIRQVRAMEAAAAQAEGLLASLEGGAVMSELAESSGLELVEAEAITRNDPSINAGLRSEVFLLQPPAEGNPVTAVVGMDDGYAVVQLDSVVDGELSDEDALRKQAYARRIANASANTEMSGFLRLLRAQSEIEVFEDRL